jgi:hypothetical protein
MVLVKRLSRLWIRRLKSVVPLVAIFGLVPATASAQIDVTDEGGRPSWAGAWSPTTPIADLARQPLMNMLSFSSLLLSPAPRVGLLWTAGTPGALASEVADERAEFSVAKDGLSGAYRRPLDPDKTSHVVGSGSGWGRLGERGAGIGRVAVDRAGFSDGVFSNVMQPYATEPYAILDTLGEATSGTAVLLEGAGGWKMGRVGFGVGLGYRSREVRTVASAVPRIHTVAAPGLTAGLNYEVLSGKLRIGVFTRWQQSAEALRIYSVAAASRVYQLSGYYDPVRTDLTATWFSQRFERNAWAYGVALGGETSGVSWALFTQREQNAASNFNTTYGDEDADRWDADGWTGGAAVQTQLSNDRLLATAHARFTTLSGEARHHDLEGVPFVADESRFSVGGEVRLLPGASWEFSAEAGVTREERRRTDGLAEVYTDLLSWRPVAAFEVARWFGRSVALSVAAALAEHNPAGSIPLKAAMSDAYGNWIAPELAVEASEAHGKAGALTLLWQARATTAFWMQARHGTVAPAQGDAWSISYRPDGDRTVWRLAMGVVLGTR